MRFKQVVFPALVATVVLLVTAAVPGLATDLGKSAKTGGNPGEALANQQQGQGRTSAHGGTSHGTGVTNRAQGEAGAGQKHLRKGKQKPGGDQQPAQQAVQTAQRTKRERPITIDFAGDTMFSGSIRQAITQHGPDYPFQHVAKTVQPADLAVLNLETSITRARKKDPVQLYNFKGNPRALQGIKDAGFDLVSLANNHVLDYGVQGLRDTLDSLDHYGLGHFGAGMDAQQAYAAKTVTIHGKRISFLGFSHFLPAVRWYAGTGHPGVASGYQLDRVLRRIRAAAKESDYVIVFIHWGKEGDVHPLPWEKSMARSMIQAGASAIIGAHPHVVQGIRFIDGHPVAYSLGNFLFPSYVSGLEAQTGLLQLTIKGSKIGVKFTPCRIKNNQIIPLQGQAKQAFLNHLGSISPHTVIDGQEVLPAGSQAVARSANTQGS